MTQRLCEKLREICDLELKLGNKIVSLSKSPCQEFPVAVFLKDSLHKVIIESSLHVCSPIKWYSINQFAGYVNEENRQSLQGPAPSVDEIAQEVRNKLSPNLLPVYDLEIKLGNKVVSVYEPAGTFCPLAVNFLSPVHIKEIRSSLLLPDVVKWLENHDLHYPIEGGYKCEETGQILIGPLSKA
jgi:hypothetical protein